MVFQLADWQLSTGGRTLNDHGQIHLIYLPLLGKLLTTFTIFLNCSSIGRGERLLLFVSDEFSIVIPKAYGVFKQVKYSL